MSRDSEGDAQKKKKKKYEKKENHLGTKIIDKSGESNFLSDLSHA